MRWTGRRAFIQTRKNAAVLKFKAGHIWWCTSQIYPGGPMSHYAACHNDTESPIDTKNNGVFFLNSRVRYEDVQDGTSSTIFSGGEAGGSLGF